MTTRGADPRSLPKQSLECCEQGLSIPEQRDEGPDEARPRLSAGGRPPDPDGARALPSVRNHPGRFGRIHQSAHCTAAKPGKSGISEDTIVQESARTEAAKQWNARACGELQGDRTSLEYFRDVEADRYRQQPWQHAYFRFGEFSGKTVLEIGIGQGSDLLQFGRAGAKCHGVDITDNHISLTTKNFELNGIQVDIRKADATALPFPDATFDCIYSFGVIHHIPEAEHVMAEIHRVLKPGGQVMIALYYKWSAFHLFSKILRDGILRGWFLTKGYAGTLATIEMGADGVKTKPYVRLYSRKDMAKLVSAFEVHDVSVHQLYASHFSQLFRWLVPRVAVRALEPRLGWYIACKARKP